MTFEEFKTNTNTMANEGGLTGKEKASFLIDALKIFMQVEADKAKTQMMIDADLGVKTAQISLINSQKAFSDQQKLSEIERTMQETYRTDVLIMDEHSLNLSKKDLTDKQATMIVRQTTGFDDKLRIDSAQHGGGIVGLMSTAGTLPTGAFDWAKTLVEKITNPTYSPLA